MLSQNMGSIVCLLRGFEASGAAIPPTMVKRLRQTLEMQQEQCRLLEVAGISPVARAPGALPDNVVVFHLPAAPRHITGRPDGGDAA